MLLNIFVLTLAYADTYRPPPKTGIIIAVYDGDTFTLDNGDKIRLRGANTPELRPAEAFGIDARDAVADLVLNQKVTLTYGDVERDGYGRLIASVRTEKHDVATYLLENALLMDVLILEHLTMIQQLLLTMVHV